MLHSPKLEEILSLLPVYPLSLLPRHLPGPAVPVLAQVWYLQFLSLQIPMSLSAKAEPAVPGFDTGGNPSPLSSASLATSTRYAPRSLLGARASP